MPFCSQCGAANHHAANQCKWCGKLFSGVPVRKGMEPWKAILIGLILPASFCGLCSLIGSLDNKNANNSKPNIATVTSNPSSTPQDSPTTTSATNPTQLQKTIEGKVAGISDGDTITVLDSSKTQHKIRLAGIDAPESGQSFGDKSKKNLSDLIFGKFVVVQYNKTDKYGRIVGKVLLDGKDICLEQIKAGLAWHYKEYQDEQSPEDRKEYAAAEDKAWNDRAGLWQERYPKAPWEYREKQKAETAESQPKQPQTTNGNSNNAQTPSTRTPGSSRVYIRGPRGGCYYINSRGNKTYVDRSLCN